MYQKLAMLPALLALGCVFAGAYGALHDQISYTVSPEYYHAFKFSQFHVPDAYHNRLGAAFVGWSASWWMGLIIGVPVLAVALIMPDRSTYLTRSLVAFVVVTITALAVGLGALAWASWAITPTNLPDFYYPKILADPVAFARAGTMHNFSYLGGFLGIVTAVVYLLVERYRLDRPDPTLAAPGGFARWCFGVALATIGVVARLGRPAYRSLMFVLALLGAGVVVDAAVTDSINRFYFHKHYTGSTILMWAGGAVAVSAAIEGVTLIFRRRLEKDARPPVAPDLREGL